MMEQLLEAFGANRFFDAEDFTKLLFRLLVDLAAAWIVIRVIYVRLYRWNEHVFTYFAFNLVTFSLCFLLRKVPIELGFALGLFAVFGILRYRTEPIRIRDLTYLFVVIGLAILNAVANKKVSVVELLSINAIIILTTYLIEYRGRGNSREFRSVVYDDLELIQPGRENDLFADLYARTGLRVVRYDVESVDLLRDVARLRVECTVDTQ